MSESRRQAFADSALDLEHGAEATRVTDTASQRQKLQQLQAELHAFLVAHTERLFELQAALPSKSVQSSDRLSVDSDKEREETISPTGDISRRSSLQSHATGFDINRAVEDHTRLLREFLQSHLQNIRSLHDALPHEDPADISPQNDSNGPETVNAKVYDSLSEQFNMQVVVSTFTASLIISFISLVQTILLDDNRIPFDIGMLLSFFAMNVHFGNIIVAGRGAALTAQHAADEDKDHHNLEYFHHYLEICEQLQFFATVLFLVAIVVYTFFIFSEIVFPLVLLGVSIVGSLIVFWSAYWRVSMTFRNLRFVIRRVRGLHFRSKAYLGRRSS